MKLEGSGRRWRVTFFASLSKLRSGPTSSERPVTEVMGEKMRTFLFCKFFPNWCSRKGRWELSDLETNRGLSTHERGDGSETGKRKLELRLAQLVVL